MSSQPPGRLGWSILSIHSVLHPQVEAMPHHWHKMRVEERLSNRGWPYTILQPAAYMQNILAHRESIVEHGCLPGALRALSTRMSLVDLEDVAEAAPSSSPNAGHVGATYELVGKEAMTQTEVASVLGRSLGGRSASSCTPGQVASRGACSGLAEYPG